MLRATMLLQSRIVTECKVQLKRNMFLLQTKWQERATTTFMFSVFDCELYESAL